MTSSLAAAPGLIPRFLPRGGDQIIWRLRDRIPLGTESVMLSQSKRRATLLVSAESPQLDGITIFSREGTRYIVHSDGSPVRSLPSQITFRITASDLLQLNEEPTSIDANADIQAFLGDLTFVAKVFRGLDEVRFEPVSVRQVGLPLSVPADERIYRAAFDFGKLDVNDHVVLLVNTSDGTPIAKFFLQLD